MESLRIFAVAALMGATFFSTTSFAATENTVDAMQTRVILASAETQALHKIAKWRTTTEDLGTNFKAVIDAYDNSGATLWTLELHLGTGFVKASTGADQSYAAVTLDYFATPTIQRLSAVAPDIKALTIDVPRTALATGGALAQSEGRDGLARASAVRAARTFNESAAYHAASSHVAPKFDIAITATELWRDVWTHAWPFLEQMKYSADLGQDALDESRATRLDQAFATPESKVLCMTIYETAFYAVDSVLQQGGSIALTCAGACAGFAGCAYTGAWMNPSCWAMTSVCGGCAGAGAVGAFGRCRSLWSGIMQ